MSSHTRIFVAATSASPLQERVSEQFRNHFGAERVLAVKSRKVLCRTGDVVVVLILPPEPGEKSSSAAFSLEGLLAPWIEMAMNAGIPVLPVLVSAAKLPQPDALPETIRDFAHAQWQVLGEGEHFQNDLGLLVSHIEAHLPERPGEFASHDHWLFLLGIPLLVVGGFSTLQWFCEVFLWPYGLERGEQLAALRRWLTLVGCWPLGAGALLCSAAAWWRNVRGDARLRADSLRRGVNLELPPRDPLAFASMGFAVASWGVGVLGAAPAILLGLAAQISFWRSGAGQPRLAFIAMVTAVLSTLAWSGLNQRMAAISRTLPMLSEGVAKARTAADDAAATEAEQLLRAAAREAPFMPQPHHALALLYVRRANGYSDPVYGGGSFFSGGLFGEAAPAAPAPSEDPTVPPVAAEPAEQSKNRFLSAALQELNLAIARYPSRAAGLAGPKGNSAGNAYQLRASLYELQNRQEEAERDRRTADRVNPWLDIFGGLLRWWDS